jgi:hypothetical protein
MIPFLPLEVSRLKHQVIVQVRNGQPVKSPIFSKEQAEQELASIRGYQAQSEYTSDVSWLSVHGSDILSAHVGPVGASRAPSVA